MLNKMVNMHRTCLLLALLEVISKKTNTDYCAKAPYIQGDKTHTAGFILETSKSYTVIHGQILS